MKKQLIRFLLIFLVAGAACGPAYLLYCTHWTGARLTELPLFSLDISPIGVNGLTTRTVKGEDKPILPVSLQLSPSMNPVAILVDCHYLPPFAGTQDTRYRVALSRANSLLWEDTLCVSASARTKKQDISLSGVEIGRMGLNSFSSHVRTFAVAEAGTYDLSVVRTGDARLHVADMKVTIRRNVTIASKPVVVAGCVLLAVGFFGLLTIGIITKMTGTT